MGIESVLSLQDIRTLFAEEIQHLGGPVPRAYEVPDCLYARGVLPPAREVAPDDRVRGGVAVRFRQGELCVFPYLLREICTNGAIAATALQARRVDTDPERGQEHAAHEFREAVRACASKEAFADAAGRMQMTRGHSESSALMMLIRFIRTPHGRQAIGSSFVGEVMMRLRRESDRSAFGVVNAVTSLARDSEDPARRWELEELGGAIAMLSRTPPSFPPRYAALAAEIRSEPDLLPENPQGRHLIQVMA